MRLMMRQRWLWLVAFALCLTPAAYVLADGIFNTQTAGGGGGPGITTITANSTPTSGFTSGHIMGSSGNVAVDTGVAYSGLGTITAGSTPAANFTTGHLVSVT